MLWTTVAAAVLTAVVVAARLLSKSTPETEMGPLEYLLPRQKAQQQQQQPDSDKDAPKHHTGTDPGARKSNSRDAGVHLVVLLHGFRRSHRDWDNFVTFARNAAKKRPCDSSERDNQQPSESPLPVAFYRIRANNGLTKTRHGTRVCARRAFDELVKVITREQQAGSPIRELSLIGELLASLFLHCVSLLLLVAVPVMVHGCLLARHVGHSFGGIIARYLCVLLMEARVVSSETEDNGIRPVHFVTIATPHLGIRHVSRYVGVCCYCLCFYLYPRLQVCVYISRVFGVPVVGGRFIPIPLSLCRLLILLLVIAFSLSRGPDSCDPLPCASVVKLVSSLCWQTRFNPQTLPRAPLRMLTTS